MNPQQLQQMYKQGLISDAQYQALLTKLGQPQGQFQTGVQAPVYNGAGALGAQIGKDAGSIVTGIGDKVRNALNQPQGGLASGATSLASGGGSDWINPDQPNALLAAQPFDV